MKAELQGGQYQVIVTAAEVQDFARRWPASGLGGQARDLYFWFSATNGDLQEREPEAHVTYFPMEERWHVHVWGRELSGFHKTKGAALQDVLDRLKIVC